MLLITSREAKRWVLPKGWLAAGELPHAAAGREAYEAGVLVGIAEMPVGSYSYDKRLKKERHVRCLVGVYALAVDEQLDDWPELDERDCVWLLPEAAAQLVCGTP